MIVGYSGILLVDMVDMGMLRAGIGHQPAWGNAGLGQGCVSEQKKEN
jgi:hypothetical protein